MAKLLGLAVLAFLGLAAVDNDLDASVNALDLTPGQKTALQTEEVTLGADNFFDGASGEDKAAIDRVVDQAFISAFRFAMFISAGMAVASAIAAALLLQGKKGAAPGKSGSRADS